MRFFKVPRSFSDPRMLLSLLLALVVPVAGTVMTKAPVLWPVSTLIYTLGLLFGFSALPGKAGRLAAYNLVAALLFVVQCAFFFSFHLQNAGFNDAFFYHLRADLLYAGIREHLPVLLGMAGCLIGFLAVSTAAVAKASPPGRQSRGTAFILGLLFFGLFLSPPVRALVLHAGPGGAKGAAFGPFEELRNPQVTAAFTKPARPNIVLIYAESLDQNYFDESVFPGLLPNLKRLREQSLDFTNVAQGVGAGWTTGGIVASQCGYPLAVSHEVGGNDLGMFDAFMPRATCFGDLLRADGYHLAFVGGADARFAGKDDFLRSHGYDEIIDRSDLLKPLADRSYQNTWGAFDDTLFDYAISKFIALSSRSAPFLLTLLTMDTHHPNGFPSRSCGVYGSGANSSLNALHCADQLIPRFIEQVRNSPFSARTLIVVVSDHLTMRNRASYLLETSQRPERLTFFVNTPKGEGEINTNPGVHYDIAPTILDLVGYDLQGQMGFGAPLTRGPGYLPGKFGEGGWEGEADNLLAISGTLWDDEVALDEQGIEFDAETLTLTMGEREFDLHAYKGYTEAPVPVTFVFDDSLHLEGIKTYSFDQRVTPQARAEELLRHQDELVFAIGRARNLAGFTAPVANPNRWVFFLGKPGSATVFGQAINGDFTVPYQLIRKMAQGVIDQNVVRSRSRVLQTVQVNDRAPR